MGPSGASLVLEAVIGGLFGLVVGSFLNVVVYRVPLAMSVVHPPSHCPTCDTELGALDNIPVVSWIVLRGRCRYCRTPISPRYPLIELTTGLVFAGVAWSLGSLRPLPSLLIVAGGVTAATAIVLDGHRVPWSVSAAIGAGAASLVAVALASGQPGRIGWAALGATAAGASTLLVSWRDHDPQKVAVVASLGWSASWLWPSCGPILAAWVLVVAGMASVGGRRAESGGVEGRPEGAGSAPLATTTVDVGSAVLSSMVAPLAVAVGALGLVLAGAALGGPY